MDEHVEDAFTHKEDEQTKLWRPCSQPAGIDCSLQPLRKCTLEGAGGRSMCLITCFCCLCHQKLIFDFVHINPSSKPQPKERSTFCPWYISEIIYIPNNLNFESLKSHWLFYGANSSPCCLWSFMWSTGLNAPLPQDSV